MYSKRSNLILGFHGCDKNVKATILKKDNSDLIKSENSWDWLGSGVYFWENNYKRAYDFAREQSKWNKEKVKTPAVVGAVLNLGRCLDLLETSNLKLLKASYDFLVEMNKTSGIAMPENTEFTSTSKSTDRLKRNLDCAVIENLHELTPLASQFDSVRGIFSEGDLLYPKSGFKSKDHIQICIRNPNCIKGYFSPRKLNPNFPAV